MVCCLMASVFYAECRIFIDMVNAIMLKLLRSVPSNIAMMGAVMLSVSTLSVIILCLIMLSVIMPSIIMLNVIC